jgi:hypothetical protein
MDLRRYMGHKAVAIGLVIITILLSQVNTIVQFHIYNLIELLCLFGTSLLWLAFWMLILFWGIRFKSNAMINIYIIFWASEFIYLLLSTIMEFTSLPSFSNYVGDQIANLFEMIWLMPIAGLCLPIIFLVYSMITDYKVGEMIICSLFVAVPTIMLAIGLIMKRRNK